MEGPERVDRHQIDAEFLNPFEEAVQVNNDVRYGLSSSIYTASVDQAFRAMQELDNGITLSIKSRYASALDTRVR